VPCTPTGQRLTLSFAWIVACAVALVVAAPAPAQTTAGVAYFPNTRAPVQIAREVNLQRAAQAGVVKLESKGGGEGDAVSLELTGKQIPGDVTVTVRAEFSVPDRLDEENRAAVRDGLAEIAAKTEAELNRTAYRSSGGDTIRFKVQYQYRDPNAPPDLGYHQVRLVNPTRDLPEPDADYRSNVEGLGKPNASEEALDATFTFGILASPTSLAHETLHLVGLDDRYSDFYRAGGQDYPLPRTGMSPSELRSWARAHKPRLAAPPSGEGHREEPEGRRSLRRHGRRLRIGVPADRAARPRLARVAGRAAGHRRAGGPAPQQGSIAPELRRRLPVGGLRGAR
jgi:hypothetical protein